MADWKAVKRVIREGKRFVITGHTYPDGDSLGSSLAFLRLLRAMGKEAVVVNPCAVPRSYRFLDAQGDIAVYSREFEAVFRRADALFVLDASTEDRLGEVGAAARRAGLMKVCIDHHPGNTISAEVKVVETRACATSQLIYELYHACGKRIGRDAAFALYAGIHTDTVSFNFLNTTAETHEIAGALLRRGVNAKKAWIRIYGNDTPALLRLTGRALAGLKTAQRGGIAWLTVRRRQLHRTGVTQEETEALTGYLKPLKGVGVIALFCEEARSRVRVSLRALDRTDVGRVARRLGGGGHHTTAGGILAIPLEKAVPLVIGALKRARCAGPKN